MNAEAIPAGQLACLLQDTAAGICADTAAIELIAASLGDPGVPVCLRAVLGTLDRRNIALVTDAITAANG